MTPPRHSSALQNAFQLKQISNLERLTKRSEQSAGECGRRGGNRSVQVAHADSEHRPRPPAAAQ
ncbi:hypothetical protein XHV734_4174 [Xanthomonas hortorum pv. vitians]|nr:hypothetical protein XHV734_4174 [Xanthomonas hortorum pv. vitians]